jgi:hypothetical protein
VPALISIFENNRAQIDSLVVHAKRMESDDVLRVLADDPERDMGFAVERGKKRMGKLPRPSSSATRGRFYGPTRSTPSSPITGSRWRSKAAGRPWATRSYRDIIQGSLIVDARVLALAVPVEYRYKSGAREAKEPSYAKTYSVIEAIYGSQRFASVRGPPSDRLLTRGCSNLRALACEE